VPTAWGIFVYIGSLPQDLSREAIKERRNTINQSRSDFISNLHIADENTLQYFYHVFDRDERTYQVYHHTFHPPTGELTEKLIDSDLYAFYFHGHDNLPITIADIKRGKGVVLRKVE
jgi:hypothetical protein